MFADQPALYTDLYTLTMSQSFWRRDRNDIVSFEMFVRSLPANRGYLMAAGLANVLDYLQNFRFTAQDLDYLRSLPATPRPERVVYNPELDNGAWRFNPAYSSEPDPDAEWEFKPLFDEGFLEFLGNLRFTGDVWALPEGTIVPAQTPLARVTAPRIQATIIESAILTLINHATMIATKASRIVSAALGRPLFDFALRRLHGPEAALTVARSSYIAGFAGSATPAAGQAYGVQVTGTMAHHYVMSYGEDREQEAFEHFLADFPNGTTLLVDTYNTLRGVRRAIAAAETVGRERLLAIRLDSGDLAELATAARAILDAAGFTHTRIFASNDLDEYKIEALVTAGAPIDAFGVGTMNGVSADAPSLGGVYKIVEQHEVGEARYIMKKAAGKQTDPGSHQVFRTADGRYTLAMSNELLDGEQLLAPVMKAGKPFGEQPTLTQIRKYAARELAALPADVKQLRDPQPLTLNRSAKLWELRARLGDAQAAELVEQAETVAA